MPKALAPLELHATEPDSVSFARVGSAAAFLSSLRSLDFQRLRSHTAAPLADSCHTGCHPLRLPHVERTLAPFT